MTTNELAKTIFREAFDPFLTSIEVLDRVCRVVMTAPPMRLHFFYVIRVGKLGGCPMRMQFQQGGAVYLVLLMLMTTTSTDPKVSLKVL